MAHTDDSDQKLETERKRIELQLKAHATLLDAIEAEIARRASKGRTKTRDTLNRTCERLECGGGIMSEASLHDNWEGTLTCTECGTKAKRYQPVA